MSADERHDAVRGGDALSEGTPLCGATSAIRVMAVLHAARDRYISDETAAIRYRQERTSVVVTQGVSWRILYNICAEARRWRYEMRYRKRRAVLFVRKAAAAGATVAPQDARVARQLWLRHEATGLRVTRVEGQKKQ